MENKPNVPKASLASPSDQQPPPRRNHLRWIVLPMALFAVLFVALPLLYVVAISFQERGEIFGVNGQFTWQNYARMLDPMIFQVLRDSLWLAGCTTVLTLLVGYPFGYFMARTSPRWRSILMLLIIVPFWTNALVRIYGWKILMQANGPVNVLLQWLTGAERPYKLLYNFGSVLLGMVYSLLPFMILPTYSAVEKMDWSFEEAARDLGSGPWRAFFTVTLPLTLPGIMAGCVLVFVPSMGLFFISDLMGGAKTTLMGNLIRDQLMKARDWGFGAALSVALMGVTTVVLWAYRKAGGRDLGVF